MYDDQPAVDTSVPHSARIWNYWLGGTDNFPVDRAAGDQVYEVYPQIVEVARASRAFLARAVNFLAAEAGVRQFLDIGSGLPTADSTHEVAQRVNPACRVVYVDNDPLVLVHAQSLLASTAEGASAYLDADAREPDKILDAAAGTLDFNEPVAVMLLGVMGNIADLAEAYAIVNRLLEAVVPGSYLVLNDGTSSEARDRANSRQRESGGTQYQSRTPDQIARSFDGLHLVEPGVVSTPLWRPEPGGTPAPLDVFCGVGRKP